MIIQIFQWRTVLKYDFEMFLSEDVSASNPLKMLPLVTIWSYSTRWSFGGAPIDKPLRKSFQLNSWRCCNKLASEDVHPSQRKKSPFNEELKMFHQLILWRWSTLPHKISFWTTLRQKFLNLAVLLTINLWRCSSRRTSGDATSNELLRMFHQISHWELYLNFDI